MLAFKGKALAVVLVTVMLSISISPMIFNNQVGTQPQSSQSGNYPSTIFGSLQQYAQEHGTTVDKLTANWTANDWIRWYKYEGNPSWGSTNITDQFLATDWIKLPNSGNLTWGADYDYEYKYNATSDQLEMWHNGTLVSYLGSDDLWHYASNRPNLTDLHHIVDREYVDHAVTSLGARYYMVGTSSGISDYKLTQLSPPSGSEDSVTKSGLADDDYIAGWISPNPNQPNKLIKGVYDWYIYAEKTGGTKTLRLYWQLVERKSNGTENVIATSITSNEILNSKNSYIIPLVLSEDYTLDDGSYVVGKIYADVSGGGFTPSIAIYFNGSSKSHWEIPTNLEIFSDQFLKLDGSNANSDVDITPYNLTVGNISAFNLKSPASYIIWTDGTNYYALNGTNGAIDYSGTDAATVIRNAVDNTPMYGRVVITEGTYTLTNAIELKSYMTLELNGELYIADAVTSNLASDASAGNNYVVVSDASLFSVGQWVALYDNTKTEDSGLYNGDGGRITNIDTGTNTITLEGNLNYNYAVADGVYLSTAHSAIVIDNKTDVVICGHGYIDGNKANQSAIEPVVLDGSVMSSKWTGENILMKSGIGIFDSDNVAVYGIDVRNAKLHGISSLYNTNIIIGRNTVHGSYHKNILLISTTEARVVKNTCYSAEKEDGIILYADNNKVMVGENICYSNGRYGLRIKSDNIISYSNILWNNCQYLADSSDILIFSSTNIISGNDNILQSSATFYAMQVKSSSDITISNVIVEDSAGLNYGLGIISSDRVSVIGGKISDATNRGITIGSSGGVYSHDIVINGVTIKDNSVGILEDSGGGDIVVSNCIFKNNTTPVTFGSPTHMILRDNIGYITESSGSSEITGTGSDTSFTISHGLATTPSQVLVTPTNSSMASATWWVSAKSSTTFTITFSSAPSNGDKLSFDWYAEV